ncbi:MAG TPA: hypothetical protein VIN03_13585 [Roseateles sp.]
MIGASLSPLASLYPATPLAPASPLGRPAGPGWLDGLGANGPATLRADVPADQRGLSVQQHAERVLSALLG